MFLGTSSFLRQIGLNASGDRISRLKLGNIREYSLSHILLFLKLIGPVRLKSFVTLFTMRERFVIVPKEEICLFIAFYQRTSKSEHPT